MVRGKDGRMARRYSEELKQEAVRLYRSSGLGYRKVAEDLGVSAYALRRWVQQAGADKGSVASSESEELKLLRREVKVLREEQATQRTAAAFYPRDVLK